MRSLACQMWCAIIFFNLDEEEKEEEASFRFERCEPQSDSSAIEGYGITDQNMSVFVALSVGSRPVYDEAWST